MREKHRRSNSPWGDSRACFAVDLAHYLSTAVSITVFDLFCWGWQFHVAPQIHRSPLVGSHDTNLRGSHCGVVGSGSRVGLGVAQCIDDGIRESDCCVSSPRNGRPMCSDSSGVSVKTGCSCQNGLAPRYLDTLPGKD